MEVRACTRLCLCGPRGYCSICRPAASRGYLRDPAQHPQRIHCKGPSARCRVSRPSPPSLAALIIFHATQTVPPLQRALFSEENAWCAFAHNPTNPTTSPATDPYARAERIGEALLELADTCRVRFVSLHVCRCIVSLPRVACRHKVFLVAHCDVCLSLHLHGILVGALLYLGMHPLPQAAVMGPSMRVSMCGWMP